MESWIYKQRSQHFFFGGGGWLADKKMAVSRVRIMLAVWISDLVIPVYGVTLFFSDIFVLVHITTLSVAQSIERPKVNE